MRFFFDLKDHFKKWNSKPSFHQSEVKTGISGDIVNCSQSIAAYTVPNKKLILNNNNNETSRVNNNPNRSAEYYVKSRKANRRRNQKLLAQGVNKNENSNNAGKFGRG
jgi:hypothetical protein